MQNWSSLLQETSSTPWRHPVWTSCWEGKAGTLLWARCRSAQRRVPLFPESRPRGGDWSGLYFDIGFSFDPTLSTATDSSRGPDVNAGRALTNRKCGLLCAKQKTTYAFSHAPTKRVLPKHQDQVSLCFNQRLHGRFCQTFQTSSCAAVFTRAVCCWITVSVFLFSKQYALLIYT